jgi:hypothetical protein
MRRPKRRPEDLLRVVAALRLMYSDTISPSRLTRMAPGNLEVVAAAFRPRDSHQQSSLRQRFPGTSPKYRQESQATDPHEV